MKKGFLAIGALALALTLASCGGKTEEPSKESKVEETSSVVEETSSVAVEDGYTVTVLLPDGTPATGVKVQWCDDSNCYMPVAVDENGKATIKTLDTEKGKYYVHVQKVPTGYSYSPYELVQTKDNLTATLTLTKLDTPLSGDGTKDNAFEINVGAYYLETAKGSTYYYYITPASQGDYVFESFAEKEMDPSIGYYGNDKTNPVYANKYDTKSGNENNFKYTLTVTADDVTANKSFVFAITSTDDAKFMFTVKKA